jgi:hypothetical protein
MKTFFDKEAQGELRQRLEKLNAGTTCEWGKMSAAQMLAHCTAGMQTPVGDLKVRRGFVSLIGWMFKGMIRSDKPFTKNSPTAPEFLMRDEHNFDTEKKRFGDAFDKLATSTITCHEHAFFGNMTDEDWGHLMYKHLDHHFCQFGL